MNKVKKTLHSIERYYRGYLSKLLEEFPLLHYIPHKRKQNNNYICSHLIIESININFYLLLLINIDFGFATLENLIPKRLYRIQNSQNQYPINILF